MYETVKVVKGYKITRMKGTHGIYHVNVREDDQIGFREFHTFRTIKAAKEFIETALKKTEPGQQFPAERKKEYEKMVLRSKHIRRQRESNSEYR